VIPRPHIEQLIVSADKERIPVRSESYSPDRTLAHSPKNLDQLGDLAKEMLMDPRLEVSKVRPFFWSMVETYVDRFQVYPFDMVKAMFCYLELTEYPEKQLRELIEKLEQTYKKQYGKSLRKPFSKAEDISPLDEEMTELRESLKYAAMFGEMEEAE